MSHTLTGVFGALKWDVVERALWTGAEGALGILVVEVANIPVWWAAPVGLVLAGAKGWIAGRTGVRGTGSTLPPSKDPAGVAGPPVVQDVPPHEAL